MFREGKSGKSGKDGKDGKGVARSGGRTESEDSVMMREECQWW